jgi:hypothetical protein
MGRDEWPCEPAAAPTPPERAALAHHGRAELPQPTLALSLWRAPGDAVAGAEAFAALAHDALSRRPGLVVTWRDADVHAGEAWAAVAMTGPPEAVAAAQAAIAALFATIPAANLDAAADAACAALTERTVRGAATPAVQATGLVADAPPAALEPARSAAARAVAKGLSRAEPTFLPLR